MSNVCLLSDEEVGRLRNYDLAPCHDAHKHISTKQALRLLKLEKVELVDYKGQQYVSPAKLHVLRSIKSDGVVKVVQRVIGNPLKHITPPPMLDLSKE